MLLNFSIQSVHRAYLRSARSIRSTLLLSFLIQYFQNTYSRSIGSIRSTLLLMLLHLVAVEHTCWFLAQRIIQGSQVVNITVAAALIIKSSSHQGLYFGTCLGISISITDPPLASNRLLRLRIVIKVHPAARAVDLVVTGGVAGVA